MRIAILILVVISVFATEFFCQRDVPSRSNSAVSNGVKYLPSDAMQASELVAIADSTSREQQSVEPILEIGSVEAAPLESESQLITADLSPTTLESYVPEVDLSTVADSDMVLIKDEILRLKNLEIETINSIKSSIDWLSEGRAVPVDSTFMEDDDRIRVYGSIGHGNSDPLYVELSREEFPNLFSIRDSSLQLFNDPVYRSYRRASQAIVVQEVVDRLGSN